MLNAAGNKKGHLDFLCICFDLVIQRAIFCFVLHFWLMKLYFNLFLATHCSHYLCQFTSLNSRIEVSKIFHV